MHIMQSPATETKQYLTFLLADEEYGVDILRVQEIKGWDTVTPLPDTPAYIKGVINLRGAIVPIIDLRERFGLAPLRYGPTTVVMVMRVTHPCGERIMGLVVDAVSDVYNVVGGHLQFPPALGTAIDTAFVKGLVTVDEKIVIVLDIDHLLNSGELAIVDHVTQD